MCGCCAGGAEGHWGSSAPFQEPSCLSVPILVLSPEGEGDAELRTLGVQCGGIAWHPFPPPSFPGGHHADPAPCHVFQRVHTHPGQRSHVWVRPLPALPFSRGAGRGPWGVGERKQHPMLVLLPAGWEPPLPQLSRGGGDNISCLNGSGKPERIQFAASLPQSFIPVLQV